MVTVYGVPIAEAIQNSSGRGVALASVHAALEPLEHKGFVNSRLGEPTAVRGGQPLAQSCPAVRRGCPARLDHLTIWRWRPPHLTLPHGSIPPGGVHTIADMPPVRDHHGKRRVRS